MAIADKLYMYIKSGPKQRNPSGNPRVQAKTIRHWYKAVLKALVIDFNIKYFSQSYVEHLCLFILRRQSSRMVSVKEHLHFKTVFVFKVEFYT